MYHESITSKYNNGSQLLICKIPVSRKGSNWADMTGHSLNICPTLTK